MNIRFSGKILIAGIILFNFNHNAFPEDKPKDITPKIAFPKIKNSSSELVCLSSEKTFPAGKAAKLTFGLKNTGATSIMCYEWKMDEQLNLVVNYTEWKGQKNLKDADWQKEIPQAKGNLRLMPLELAPNNKVLIDKELDFISKIPSNIKEPMTFYVYAELYLESLAAKSGIIKITVLPDI